MFINETEYNFVIFDKNGDGTLFSDTTKNVHEGKSRIIEAMFKFNNDKLTLSVSWNYYNLGLKGQKMILNKICNLDKLIQYLD